MGSTSFRSLDDVGLTDLQVEEIIGFCKYNANWKNMFCDEESRNHE
jgi:hypothetical protein